MSVSIRIKFRCSSCEKPLSIGRKKAGATVTCPKCKSKIVVPEESELVDRQDSDDNPFDEFQVFDDDFDEPDLVYEDENPTDPGAKQKLNDRLSVPRKLVYMQGALLGIVAILFFLLGLIVGSAGKTEKNARVDSSTIKGMIVLDNSVVDEGAVVFLLPSKLRPQTKFESEELRPGRTFTSANPEVPIIRKFGGNVCTTNQAGQFKMKVKPNQEYVLLVISANGSRRGDLDSDYHTNVGHYFTSLDDLTDGKVCFYKKIMPLRASENLGEILLKSEG